MKVNKNKQVKDNDIKKKAGRQSEYILQNGTQ